MNVLAIGVAACVALSLIVAVIEISHRSGSDLRQSFAGPSWIFVVILIVGNSASTFVATYAGGASSILSVDGDGRSGDSSRAEKGDPEDSPDSVLGLDGLPAWLQGLAVAFVGVFGFEVIMQNVNVTLAGHGVLTINDWVNKARDRAVAAAVSAQVDFEALRTQAVADELAKKPIEDLRAYALNAFGESKLDELKTAASKAGAGESRVLAELLVVRDFKKFEAVVKST